MAVAARKSIAGLCAVPIVVSMVETTSSFYLQIIVETFCVIEMIFNGEFFFKLQIDGQARTNLNITIICDHNSQFCNEVY